MVLNIVHCLLKASILKKKNTKNSDFSISIAYMGLDLSVTWNNAGIEGKSFSSVLFLKLFLAYDFQVILFLFGKHIFQQTRSHNILHNALLLSFDEIVLQNFKFFIPILNL